MGPDPVVPPPPPGFTLDATKQGPIPPPPPGFTMDAAAPAPAPGKPGFFSRLIEPIKGAVTGIAGMAGQVGRGDIAGAARSLMQPNLDALNRAGESFGEGDYASMARHGIAAAVPLVGPMTEVPGDLAQQGDYRGAAGSTLGNAALLGLNEIPKVGRAAARGAAPVLESAGTSLYRNALKPTMKRASGGAVEAGLREGIPVSEAGATKAGDVVSRIEDQVGATVDQLDKRIINPGKAAQYGAELKQQYANRAAPTESLAAVDKILNDFYTSDRPGGAISAPGKAARNITARQALDIKKATYREVGDTAYGERKTPPVETKKQIARAMNDAVAEVYPEVRPMLQQEGQAINLKRAIESSVNRHANASMLPYSTPLTVGGALVHGAPGGAVGFGASVGLKILKDPAIKSQVALHLYRAGQGLRSIGEAKSLVNQRIAALTKQTRQDPHVKTPSLERPSLGLSIEHRGRMDEGAPRAGNTPEPITTTKTRIYNMAAALMEDGGVDNPQRLDGAAKAVFGDTWNTDNKGVVIAPEQALAGGREQLAHRNNRSFSGQVPTRDEFWGRTAKGASIRPWYKEGIKEWADEIGHDEAIKQLDTMASASPQVPVQRAVTESLLGSLNKKLGVTDWDVKDPVMDQRTGRQAIDRATGQPKEQFRHFTGIPNRDAAIKVLNDLSSPSGRKVGPFAKWSKQVLTGDVADSPVIDTHALQSATGRIPKASTSDADFWFADARHRIDAYRLGLPLDEQQAANWGGRNRELKAAEGPGARSLFEEDQPKVDNPNAQYIDFIRQGQKDVAARTQAPAADASFDFGANEPAHDALAKPETGPNPAVSRVAEAYNASKGLKKPTEVKPSKIDLDRARAIARAYDAMPAADPRAKPAYDALKREVKDQWDAAEKAGYTFEPWNREGQPYKNSSEMRADVRNNKHLFFFQGGEPHPFLNDAFKGDLTYNDAFRAVHDLFGHAKNGLEFGPKGEEAAWKTHVQMFSPAAAKAMTSETRGQNSWVNFGPHNPESLPLPERPYAKQKAALLPDEFTTDQAHTMASIVRLKNGMILQSKAVPMNSRNLPTHLSILEQHNIPVDEVVDSGFKIGSEYQWDSGGGTIGRGEMTLGQYEADKARKAKQ